MALIFDIETDGFLETVTKIHCLVIKDTSDNNVYTYTGSEVEQGVKHLMEWSEIGTMVAHNGLKFDLAVIQKLYPWFTVDQSKVLDTLVLSRLIYSDLRERDGANIENGLLPTKLWASHSLKAWGYRLGMLKGEYGEQENAWETFTPEMLEYCVQDVEVTHKLYQKMLDANYSQQAIELEHKVAFICARMERSGWPFDKEKASALYAELVTKREAIKKQMDDTFEPLVEERWSEKTGKKLKDKVTPFNPGSRQQIADRLIKKYQWEPKEFTPAGQVKIDEDVLKKLDYPEAKTLAEYFLVDKRIAQLSEGDQGWLKLERNGIIHGSINTNGAVTGRATHQSPNLAQVPAVRSPYGKQCRELFTVRPGFKQVGCDLSGLELRCLAHFMHRWDDGEYGNTVINGKQSDGTDIHTVNQRAAGLTTRDQAKTFIYAFLYGAGDHKIGSITGGGSREGKSLKAKFLSSTPALKKLREAVGGASKRGYLIGLDGRRLHVRSEHAALNTLLQSAGALISKQWLIEVDLWATEQGYKYGWDGDWTMLGWIHDEVQLAVKENMADDFGKAVVDCATRAGSYFKFNLPIGAEYSVGMNWAETH
jgi:DNA polymerase I-like protein with 3'-5' exonuclease and polymerase domains